MQSGREDPRNLFLLNKYGDSHVAPPHHSTSPLLRMTFLVGMVALAPSGTDKPEGMSLRLIFHIIMNPYSIGTQNNNFIFLSS